MEGSYKTWVGQTPLGCLLFQGKHSAFLNYLKPDPLPHYLLMGGNIWLLRQTHNSTNAFGIIPKNHTFLGAMRDPKLNVM